MPGLISLDELTSADLMRLTDRSVELFHDRRAHDRPLRGHVAGMMFLQTSTRTRTAFQTGAVRLGADIVAFGPHDLQLNTGESIGDTGRIFGSMLDLLVVRTNGSSSLLGGLSDSGALPVINAMSAEEHPTQGVNDLASMRLQFGDLTGLRVLYVGEGNNSAVALAKVLSHVSGCHVTFWTPPGYGLDDDLIKVCDQRAALTGGRVEQISDSEAIPTEIDLVYTTRWQTTGTAKSDPCWREKFRPFYIDEPLLKRWPDALVMHDLPAHRGEEISGEVLDGPRSIAWRQAQMKATSAMAVLERAAVPAIVN